MLWQPPQPACLWLPPGHSGFGVGAGVGFGWTRKMLWQPPQPACLWLPPGHSGFGVGAGVGGGSGLGVGAGVGWVCAHPHSGPNGEPLQTSWASALGVLSGAASTSPAASNRAGTSTASTRQTPRLLDAAILVAPFGKVELSSYQRPRPDPKGNQAIQLEPHNLSGLTGIVYVHVHAAFGSWQEPTATREQRASPPNSHAQLRWRKGSTAMFPGPTGHRGWLGVVAAQAGTNSVPH